MNKNKISILLFFSFLLFACTDKNSVSVDKWSLTYNEVDNTMDVSKDSKLVFNGVYPSYKLADRTVTSKDYSAKTLKKETLNDAHGKGTVFSVTYTDEALPTLTQSFYMYSGKDYVLTDFTLSGDTTVSSNYMAPVNIDKMEAVLNAGDNRALFVPYDNDCWVRYQSHALDFDSLTSYEVTAIFNNEDRNGLVIGSIEHDNWKTAVKMKKGDVNNIGSLVCYGGVADSLTRDSKAHGTLTAKIIKSPKVMIGLFNDWREGLEEFGKANAVVAPPKTSAKAVPVGWNSWGALQFSLTYEKAVEVSDFFKENLQNNNFVNGDKTLIIGLDAGWGNLSEDQLKAFVQKCKDNGQVAGIYWCPFTDWSKEPEKALEDAPNYKNKEVYVYANGQPQMLDGAYAIDPTHPAIEERMKTVSEKFRRCGFEYVKMDFMTHGAFEGDKWFRPEIQTGTQAYNYGMDLLRKYFGDMFVNLSISPIFPAQYAESRRIACDAWNQIKDTEYTMNAVSYGWWVDNVYQYNDADHVVLRDATEGENRARITSAVITGLYIVGDDFSKAGPAEGKERSTKYLTNAEVNAIANGVSFRPVEGNGEKSESLFMRTDDKGVYFVVFNYGDDAKTLSIPLDRLGLNKTGNYTAKELWSGEALDLKAEVTVPGKDVKIIRILK